MNRLTTPQIATITTLAGMAVASLLAGFVLNDTDKRYLKEIEGLRAENVKLNQLWKQPGARLDGCIVSEARREDAEYYSTTTVQCEDGRIGMFLVPKNGARLGMPEGPEVRDKK